MINFVESITSITMLMAVHLNDCEINRNVDMLSRMLYLFGLSLDDIPKQRQDMINDMNSLKIDATK